MSLLQLRPKLRKQGQRSSHVTKILRKLADTRWDASTDTMHSTALTLTVSTAEYACPAWEISPHAWKHDSTLNASCRSITGCLQSTNMNKGYQLAGIAPPHIRRSMASRVECLKQAIDERHPLNNHPAANRRKRFITCTLPIQSTPESICFQMWKDRISTILGASRMESQLQKSPGANESGNLSIYGVIPFVQPYVTVAMNLRKCSIYCNAPFWRKPAHLTIWRKTTSGKENVFSSGSMLSKDMTEEAYHLI